MAIFPSVFLPEKLRSFDAVHTEPQKVFQMVANYLYKKGVSRNKQMSSNSLRVADDGSCISFSQDQQLRVINFLIDKRDSCIIFTDHSSIKGKANVDSDDTAASTRVKSYDVLCEGEPVIIDDNPASLINTPMYFSLVNGYIAAGMPTVNIDACYSVIEAVERETSKQAEADILAGI